MRIALVLFLFIVIAGTSSCLNDKKEEIFSACDTTYYATTIRPLIKTHCMGNNGSCHIAGGAPNIDYAYFQNLKDRIDNNVFQTRVFNLKDMPPSNTPLAPLSDTERNLIQAWVNDGAIGCD